MSDYTSGPLKMLEKTENGVRIATADGKKVVGMAWAGLVDSGLPSRTEAEANAALWIAAPETAAERDGLRIVNAELINALELAAKYLGKAVAGGLMDECVRSPRYALMIANRALANARVNWPKREASLAELVEKWNEDDHE